MIAQRGSIADRAAELRQAFDRTFAQVPRNNVATLEAFLAIGAGGDVYALRLGEIAGLFADKKIATLPSRVPELLGVAGFRGALVPVYDLPALLGSESITLPRWLVLVMPMTPVGLAFDRFEGHFHVPPDAVARDVRPEVARPHVRGVVQIADTLRPIIHVASVLEAITHRGARGTSQKDVTSHVD